MGDSVHITRASHDDALQILSLIRRAFDPVAALYDDPDLPPLAETLEQHLACYDARVVLKACTADGALVGSVQGEPYPDGSVHVARLVVAPEQQGRGIARALMTALEAEFPAARTFGLFTGSRSDASLGLYASLGYRETRRESVDGRYDLVWMEKRVR